MTTETNNLPVKLDYILKQVPVTAENQQIIGGAISKFFAKLADWETRVYALEITGADDVTGMQKAAEGLKFIAAHRIEGVAVLNKLREGFKEEMSEFVAADRLCLKAIQNLEADSKALEQILKDKRDTAVRLEREAEEKLRLGRLEQIQDLCDNPSFYPLGKMSEGDFQNLKAVLTDTFNRLQEAERQMAAVEAAQEQAEKNRLANLQADKERLEQQLRDTMAKDAEERRLWQKRTKDLVGALRLSINNGDIILMTSDDTAETILSYDQIVSLSDEDFGDIMLPLITHEENKIEHARKLAAKAAEIERQEALALKQKADRTQRLHALGFIFDGEIFSYGNGDIVYSLNDELSDEEFDMIVSGLVEDITAFKDVKLEEALSAAEYAEQTPDPAGLRDYEVPAPDPEPAPLVKLKPKERVTAWVSLFELPPFPGTITGKAGKTVKDISDGFEAWKIWCEEQIEKL